MTETLPAGFDYGSSSLASSDVASAGQEVTFSLGMEPSNFTYTVTASDTAGTYDFSGIVTNEGGEEQDVDGDSTVTVEEPTPPAATHNGSRSFAPASVTQGGEVVVTITADGYGSFGSVEETLPEGFAYVSSSLAADDVEQSGQMVTFTLLGGGSFNYTLTASGTAGTYDFTGVLRDADRVGVEIGGDSQVTVIAAAAAHSGSRSFSAMAVVPGAELSVSISASNYGSFGQVTETLPSGFVYVSSSLAADDVEQNGQMVIFTLLGRGELRLHGYRIRGLWVPTTSEGVLSNSDRVEVYCRRRRRGQRGAKRLRRTAPAESFSPAPVDPEAELTADHHSLPATGAFGEVVETLPGGFGYTASSLGDDQVEESGQTVTFTLLGESDIIYTAMAPSDHGVYSFSGVINDADYAGEVSGRRLRDKGRAGADAGADARDPRTY